MSPILQGLANGSVRGYGGYLPLGPSGAFESIASATGTGSSSTITFSSIPSTYASLQIRGIVQWTFGNNDSLALRLNGDTNANYASHHLMGDGTSVIATGLATQSRILMSANGYSWDSGYPVSLIVDIHDYASTTKTKTVRVFMGCDINGTPSRILISSGLWNSTAAISSLSLITESASSFRTTTQLALYGVKGA
jgi:hypothetical protein